MESNMPRIRDITSGDTVKTLLIVASAVQKQAKNGPFWTLELKDATGSIEARIWSPLSQSFKEIPEDFVAEVEGRAERYRDQLQLSVTSLRPLLEEELLHVDMSLLVPSSQVSSADLFQQLLELCQNVFTYQPWLDFVMHTLNDPDIRSRLLVAPAACNIHHAWVGGLLEHTLGVTRLCLTFADLYPDLDRQTLAAGAIFHDIGKLWELSGGLHTSYTDAGRLLGHISLGLALLDSHLASSELPEGLKLHFRHLILSHHGQREFGSPCLPQTPEALALHYADNLDAKLVQCRTLFKELPQGRWSSYQKTLDRNLFHPFHTPESSDIRNSPVPTDSESDKASSQAAPFLNDPFMTASMAEALLHSSATPPCPLPPDELDALFTAFDDTHMDDAPVDTLPWDMPSPVDSPDSGLFPLDEAVPDPLPESPSAVPQQAVSPHGHALPRKPRTPRKKKNTSVDTAEPSTSADNTSSSQENPAAGTVTDQDTVQTTTSKTEPHSGAEQCSLL